MSKIHIISGGTVSHVRPHLALCAPAYGTTGFDLLDACQNYFPSTWSVGMNFTRMAGGHQDPRLETNEDVSSFLGTLIADKNVKVIFMAAALCDFDVASIESFDVTESDAGLCTNQKVEKAGKHLPRLKTSDYQMYQGPTDWVTPAPEPTLRLALKPSEKIIRKIRATRKDIFLVGFKTTTGATVDEQFDAGLRLLKEASCNLVLANDLHTRLNMIVTPEQAKYAVTTDRSEVIETLVEMAANRCQGTFTRSTVVPGEIVNWDSPEVPANLRAVVNHAIDRGAYRPFNGKTVGHFAVKVGDGLFLTSIRKTNFNDHPGLVKVETKGNDEVVAHGARPSVGGQSQRMIFAKHPDLDCIFHAHVQLKAGSKVPVREQWQHECGSHQCGQNTASGLQKFDDGIWAVMLERHGPNVVFSKEVPAEKIIAFIEENFDLTKQTSELS